MNRDQQHEAAKEALAAGWQVEGPERTDRLITALTHAVLALSAPIPVVPEEVDAEDMALLLAAVREFGGRWDWKRAQDRFAYLGRPHYADRAKERLKLLAQGGYLTEVEKGVYELRATDGSAPSLGDTMRDGAR